MKHDQRTGEKLATLRGSHGISVEELAQRSGCDPSVIEQLEGGELAPSLAPLIKITRALGCRLGTLLDDDTQLGPVVTRRAESASTARLKSLETGTASGGSLTFSSLAAGKSARHMEPFMIDVAPGDSHDLSAHEGEEFIHVLDGAIEVEYGKETHTLAAGDSIYYDSVVPHQVRAAAGAPAKILAVVFAPV
ncbi:MAG: cupin domain-containing protein [Thermoleophilia bacterium]